MTVYTSRDVPRNTMVYDVDTKEKVMQVIAVDTGRNVLVRVSNPVEVAYGGNIITFETQYSSIYPISGMDALPGLFHCYGKLSKW